MTWFAGLQLVLAAVVGWIVVERMRTLLFVAPLETKRYVNALTAAVADGDLAAARALAEAGRPAWVAEVARAALSDEGDVDEVVSDYRYEAFRRLRALRILASVGTASGFFGAVLELIWLFSGDHGLAGLQAGRVERVALEHALVIVSLGVAISMVAFVALGVLKRAAVALVKDVQTAATSLPPR